MLLLLHSVEDPKLLSENPWLLSAAGEDPQLLLHSVEAQSLLLENPWLLAAREEDP
jgi:hypothetical protein